ncbi:MAG: DUF4446 family protein [Armatimonadota bacterium]|nr:DUF4446 family protein [Armatimonadota bacterium]MDR7444143.1 DUF4446 family protein [Armatimonadota bacterium]MDR7569560.1 DUF4446 family protein [Armatimonadota bacterium]MDR7613592.1 DUF4446 family protein [Armatimonadota bacterium]
MREHVLVWVLGAITGVLLVFVGILGAWVRRLVQVARASTEDALAEQLREHRQGLEELRADLQSTRASLAELGEQLSRCVQRVGLVRFDAFEDVGGRVSFALALLDGKGDGVVLSVLNGREAVRAYAKTLVNGTPSHPLSVEEKEAIAMAQDVRRTQAVR